jgi:hypothetical protein
MTPESGAVPRSLVTRSERQSATRSELSDPAEVSSEPGLTAARPYSSQGTKTAARETFSTVLEAQSHAAGPRQYSPIRTEEKTRSGPSARRTKAGPDIAARSSSVIVWESSPQIPKLSVPLTSHAPASWVQVPDSTHLSSRQQEEIQTMAEALLTQIQAADQQGANPEAKIAIQSAAILSSDAEFRRKYGQRAWMEHHIQAYHLGLAR